MKFLRILCQSLLIFTYTLTCLPAGVLGDGNVTLESLTIFRSHEWFGKPLVYFRCRGEKKVYLPDVVNTNEPYNFIGQESWQPLTVLEGTKCKRCGLYEEDQIKHDDVFDEWELCPIHFSSDPEGHYNHFKEKELNISFTCPYCHPSDAKPSIEPVAVDEHDENRNRKKKSLLVFVLTFFSITTIMALLYVGYLKWQQKVREDEQARFIKLFEDDEDLEAEFGLRD